MKKSLAVVMALTALLVMLFAACGGNDDMTDLDSNLTSSNPSSMIPSGDVDDESTSGGLLDDSTSDTSNAADATDD